MKILYVHEVNYRKKVVFEMHEFPELLSLNSNHVTFFEYPENQFEGVNFKINHEIISGRVYENAVIELVTPPTFGGFAWERYIAPVFAFFALKKLFLSRPFDAVVLLAVPTSGWQTVLLANHHQIPTVFRALDVSHKIRKNLLSPLIKLCEKYIYKNVTVLSANTPAMMDYCVKLGHRTKPSTVNLPPVDLEHFAQTNYLIKRNQLGLKTHHEVLLYMGTFFTFSGLVDVIEDFHLALTNRPNLRLVLVGGGELDEVLRAKVVELGLQHQVIFTGVVPYQDLPGYLKIADVAINPFEKELLTDVALPHKVLQYMAAGVPVVSTSLDGIRSVLGEDSGVTWCSGPEQIVTKSIDLLENKSDLVKIINLQKEKIRHLFDLQRVTESMIETIKLAIRSQGAKPSEQP